MFGRNNNKKKSFFERFTGAVRIDSNIDYGDEDEEVFSDQESGNIIDEPIAENPRVVVPDWQQEETLPEPEGELTVDVYERSVNIIIKAMVAGVRPDDLDISITRDRVTIHGKREGDHSISSDKFYHRELYWGSFSRTILLPEEINVEESEAVEKHGLLIITLPKINKNQQTRLKVKTN